MTKIFAKNTKKVMEVIDEKIAKHETFSVDGLVEEYDFDKESVADATAAAMLMGKCGYND